MQLWVDAWHVLPWGTAQLLGTSWHAHCCWIQCVTACRGLPTVPLWAYWCPSRGSRSGYWMALCSSLNEEGERWSRLKINFCGMSGSNNSKTDSITLFGAFIQTLFRRSVLHVKYWNENRKGFKLFMWVEFDDKKGVIRRFGQFQQHKGHQYK